MGSVDFLMPQYYNGPFRPAQDQGLDLTMDHMENLVNAIFNGDQSKVLFGFCINDCSQTGSNVNSDEAVSIVRKITTRFPNFGGAFLWAASDDSANSWSGPVSAALNMA